jgi:putative MATE family efflux protein
MEEKRNDFTKGSVQKNIMNLALPMILAQLINVLYNVVDRMYIGRIPDAATLALTGLGLTFPIITIINAFANLFGMGGAPLCSIARGKNDNERAEKIMGNSFSMMILVGIILMIICFIFKKPILYYFGASDITFPYANAYITIYLFGTLFVMIGLGMNSFVNSQGFGKIGMMTVLLGAIVNIILDPIFIFLFDMGVQGAALATIISQFLSAAWILKFLTGKKAILKLRRKTMKLDFKLIKEIVTLGFSGFVMSVTNSAVQVICNTSLQFYGGDLYVGVMTVINSIREILTMPVNGMTNASQPVLGYNYGANEYKRVRTGIKFISVISVSYTVLIWLLLMLIPEIFIRIFNNDPTLIAACKSSMKIYFFSFFMMSLQFAGQSTFVALGKSKQAVFFSLLRKAIIVIPLTLLLPRLFSLGTAGVFLAEPISDIIGGSACYLTMLITVFRHLKQEEKMH